MIGIVFGIVPTLILVDLILKNLAEARLKEGESREVLGGHLLIRKVYNRGMCLNAMDDRPDLVKKISLGASLSVTLYLIYCLFRQKNRRLKQAGLVLMAAGGWSNTIDRCLRHYVVDYFGFGVKWEKLKKVTFNLGDMFLFIGGILVAIGSAGKKNKD